MARVTAEIEVSIPPQQVEEPGTFAQWELALQNLICDTGASVVRIVEIDHEERRP